LSTPFVFKRKNDRYFNNDKTLYSDLAASALCKHSAPCTQTWTYGLRHLGQIPPCYCPQAQQDYTS